MAFTVNDFQDLLRLLRERPEWKDELRVLILGEEFARMPADLARANARLDQLTEQGERHEAHLARIDDVLGTIVTVLNRLVARADEHDARLDQLTEQGERHEAHLARIDDVLGTIVTVLNRLVARADEHDARMDQLIERMDQLAARLDQLAERMDQLAARLDQLAERVDQLTIQVSLFVTRMDRMEGRMGNFEGQALEARYRANPGSYLMPFLRRPRVVDISTLDALDEGLDSGALRPDELQRLRLLDLLVVGRLRDGAGEGETFVAVEVSATVNVEDVERAARAAAILTRFGYPARGLAAGYDAPDAARDAAAATGVLLDVRRAS